MAHLSSWAKKADAFFNISTSPRNWRFSLSRWRLRWCSAVKGLPMQLCTSCSASNCTSQRLTAVAPRLMSLQTCPMLKPRGLDHLNNLQLEAGVEDSSGFGIAHVCYRFVLTTCRFIRNNLTTTSRLRGRVSCERAYLERQEKSSIHRLSSCRPDLQMGSRW